MVVVVVFVVVAIIVVVITLLALQFMLSTTCKHMHEVHNLEAHA